MESNKNPQLNRIEETVENTDHRVQKLEKEIATLKKMIDDIQRTVHQIRP